MYANAVLLLRLPHHVRQENLPQNALSVLAMKQNGVQGTRISKAKRIMQNSSSDFIQMLSFLRHVYVYRYVMSVDFNKLI